MMDDMTDTAVIWLTIATGGLWTLADVRKECPGMRPKSITQALAKMAEAGCLHEYADGSYGVTMECRPPRGIPMRDILQAVGAR